MNPLAQPIPEFLSNGGEMGELTRAHDWARTPLGTPGQWPEALKTTLRLVLTSHQPMFIWWGPQLIQFYNDAYRQTMGPERHPSALGQPGRACWEEIWPIIGPQIESVLAGGAATWHEDQLVPVTRHGKREDVWWTYGYSPIQDSGGVRGVLVVCNDVTREHLARQELELLNGRLLEQLRQRDAEHRRQSFRLEMAERLRGIVESATLMPLALGLLADYVGAAQVCYADVDQAGDSYRIAYEWRRDGLQALLGREGRLADYGPQHIAALAQGRTLAVTDVRADAHTAPHAAAYAALGVGAVLAVPIVKQGSLVAILSCHQDGPCAWPEDEFSPLEDVAERVWGAVERNRASARQARAEQALRDQRAAEDERLRAMFDQSPGFMCILRGPEHVYEFANAAYQRLLGGRPLLNRTVRAAIPESVEQGFIELLDQVYRSAQPFTGTELPLRLHTPGQAPLQIYVDFIYQPIVGADGSVSGIFVDGFDASERVLSRRAREQSETRLQEGLVAARMAIWEWDLASREVKFSANAPSVLGGQWDRIDTIWQSIHPDDLARLDAVRAEAVERRGSYADVVRLIRPDNGQIQWLQVNGTVICDDAGRPVAIRGVTLDITARKSAEVALREADRRKDEFLAMLAHELRNPLAPISAAAQLLNLNSDDPHSVRKAGAVIARQVAHMRSLLSDLLDVSRVTTGLVALDKRPLDMRQIALESIEQVRPLIEKRRHDFSFHAMPTSSMVLGDRMRLVQVLTNLLQNAAKYTEAGGHITLAIEERGEDVAVSVSDNGSGIDGQLLPHVFDLFTQAQRTSDRSQGGLGLGLALVRSLVNLHGGRIQAASDGIGRGSVFTLFMPRLHNGATATATDAAPAPAAPASAALKLLVVDDNADAAEILALLLQELGHEVVVANDSHSAIAHASAAAHDICLLDIGLPDIDGYDLARQIRASAASSGTTLVALTGYGQQHDRERARQAGFDHFFVKPVEISELLQILKK